MLGFAEDTKNDRKCYVTHGMMGHLDPKQPPIKRKPFDAILSHPFIHKAGQLFLQIGFMLTRNQVELVLPQEIYEIIKKDLFDTSEKPIYSRVILPLKALLEGEFFNEYIKRGRRAQHSYFMDSKLTDGRKHFDALRRNSWC